MEGTGPEVPVLSTEKNPKIHFNVKCKVTVCVTRLFKNRNIAKPFAHTQRIRVETKATTYETLKTTTTTKESTNNQLFINTVYTITTTRKSVL